MPETDQLLELVFPLGGMNITTEFELQPANTTSLGINVRSIEPSKQRNRGGSRHGLIRYVDQKLGLHSLIQHLNLIVDPTIEATLSEFEDDYWFDPRFPRRRGRKDPSNLGRGKRYLRRGGSGIRPRRIRNAPTAENDTASATIGGAPVEAFILSNDTYLGQPTVSLGKPRNLLGGTVALSGPVGGWRIGYTPAASGTRTGEVVVPYRLTATGNQGRDYAELTITVEPAARLLGPYNIVITDSDEGDGFAILTIDAGSGMGTTSIWLYSDGFDPEILQAAAEEAALAGAVFITTDNVGLWALGANVATIDGDYGAGPGYEGSVIA